MAILCLNFTLFSQTITVNSPVAGTYNVGDTITISYTTSGTSSSNYYTFQLYKGTEYEQTIYSSWYGTSSYKWIVPSSMDTTQNYRIKVLNSTNNTIFAYSPNFKIANLNQFKFLTPAKSETLSVKTPYYIKFSAKGSNWSYFNLALVQDSTYVQDIAYSASTTSGQYLWNVPSVSDTTKTYRIRATAYGDYKSITYSEPFYIRDRWSLSITNPDKNDTFFTNQYIPVEWNSTGLGSYVNIYLISGSSSVATIISSYEYNDGYFSFSPNAYSGGSYRIKIASSDNLTKAQTTDFFTLQAAPSITINAPISNAIFRMGTTDTIKWSTTGDVGSNVTIKLLQYGTTIQTITESTPNTGIYLWNIGTAFTEGTNYQIQIISSKSSTVYKTSSYFSIWKKSSLAVSAPKAGDTLNSGLTFTIKWNSSLFSGNYVNLSLYKNGSYYSSINTYISNYGTYSWSVPFVTEGQYTIGITGTDYTAYQFSENFYIVNRPKITWSTPSENGVYEGGQSISCSWTTSGFEYTPTIKFSYSLDSGKTWSKDSLIYNYSYYSSSMYWYSPKVASKNCLLKLTTSADTTIKAIRKISLLVRPQLFAVPEGYNKRPLLRWTSTGIQGETYTIKIDTSFNMYYPIINAPVSDTFFMPTSDLPSKTIYWQITPTLNPSLAVKGSFYIYDKRIPSPIAIQPNPTTSRKPCFKWNSVNGASSYTLQVATDSSFYSTLLSIPIIDTSYCPIVNLPYGMIYWKVKSDLLDKSSMIQSFRIAPDTIPILKAFSGSTVKNLRPTFSWSKVPNANYYRIEIYDSVSYYTPRIAMILSDTFYTPGVDLKPGRYTWHVSVNGSANSYSDWDSIIIAQPVGVINYQRIARATSAACHVKQGKIYFDLGCKVNTIAEMSIFSLNGSLLFRDKLSMKANEYKQYSIDKKIGAGNYIYKIRLENKTFSNFITVR